MNNDLISRKALKERLLSHRKYIEDRIRISDLLFVIDDEPAVEPEKAKESKIIKAYTKGFDMGVETVKDERPQGECEKCDFRKFTETFVDGVVDMMNKNGITSVEQLSEILKSGADMRKEDKK